MSERMSEERLKHIKDRYDHYGEAALGGGELLAEIDALRAELSRAEQVRKWEMGQECRRSDCANVRAEIDALRAELAAAERNWAEQEKRGTIAQTDLNIALNKLAAAERERDRARADALEEAADVVERTAISVALQNKLGPGGYALLVEREQSITKAIRALKGEP